MEKAINVYGHKQCRPVAADGRSGALAQFHGLYYYIVILLPHESAAERGGS